MSEKSKTISLTEFIVIVALMISMVALSIDTVLPSLSVMGKDLKVIDTNNTQYVISVFFIGFTIGQFIYGPFADSWGRKYTIYIGMLLYIVGSILCALTVNFPLMLIGRFLQGLGVASPRICSTAMTRDKYAGREMARVTSFIMSVLIFVPVLAPIVGQAILEISSWRMIFVMYLLVAIPVLLSVYFRLPETLTKENRREFSLQIIWSGFKEVLSNRETLIYTLCVGFVFGAFLGYLSTARQVFQDYFGVGEAFPYFFAVSALSVGLASSVNAMIVRRFGMRLLCNYSLLCKIGISIIYLVYVLNHEGPTPLWTFMIYTPMIFFCNGLLFGNLNALAMEPMGRLAGMASAVVGTVSSAISVVVGIIIGQSYNNTVIPIICGFLILSIVTWILQAVLSLRTSAK